MKKQDEKVLCRTPTEGKSGTRIARWKYEAVREAILNALPQNQTGIPFKELPSRVEKALAQEEREKLGSIPWYTTTVKLDLEVRGEIERVQDISPQHLRRTM